MTPDIASDSAPGRAPDPAADLLDGRHQRVAEQHRPGNAEAELGAHLGVSGDAARIVVPVISPGPRMLNARDFAGFSVSPGFANAIRPSST
jgi:hypothetical protein